MLLIVVLFHLSPFKHFKAFYHYGIGQQYRAYFGDLPHYDRFISLMPRLFVPLTVLLHSLSGEPSGVYFADSTKLAVCHNRRIHRHRVFKGLAARGKTSMGWFYGLKLHFVINHKGQIMALKITPGNTADSTMLDSNTSLASCRASTSWSARTSIVQMSTTRYLHLAAALQWIRPTLPPISLVRACNRLRR